MTLPATLSSALIIAKGLVGQANTSQCVPTTDSITTVHGIQQIEATVFSELGSAHNDQVVRLKWTDDLQQMYTEPAVQNKFH